MEPQPVMLEEEPRERETPHPGSPGFGTWAAARHGIDQLRALAGGPRWLRRGEMMVAGGAIELVTVPLDYTVAGWWNVADPSPIEHAPVWLALRPAVPGSRVILAAGTRLQMIAQTDPHWTRHVQRLREDALFDVLDGPIAGHQVLAVQEGPSDAATGVAGQLITMPAADLALFAGRVLDLARPFLRETCAWER